MTEGPFADSRTVQESNGGYTVSIPKAIVDRHDIEGGDEVWWTEGAGADGPTFHLPGELGEVEP